MSAYVTDMVYHDFIEGLFTDHPLTHEDIRKHMIQLMEDDPVVLEEVAYLCLEVVNWKLLATKVNYEAGVS